MPLKLVYGFVYVGCVVPYKYFRVFDHVTHFICQCVVENWAN